MSEMVERVARAMWDGREQTLPERIRQPFDERLTADIFIMARAAIAVMREPTEAMNLAGNAKFPCGTCSPKFISPLFTAMIDAALK